MVEVDAVIAETKREVRKFQGEIKGAERLTWLLHDMGVPVVTERARVTELKQQAKKMETALKNDKKYYGKP